jgi:hypothetical protein
MFIEDLTVEDMKDGFFWIHLPEGWTPAIMERGKGTVRIMHIDWQPLEPLHRLRNFPARPIKKPKPL